MNCQRIVNGIDAMAENFVHALRIELDPLSKLFIDSLTGNSIEA